MDNLIGSVVSLTGFRDRDVIASTMVAVLSDWLQPLSIRMYRCIGAAPGERLLLQSGVRHGDIVEPGDVPWTAPESLPALADWPTHRLAMSSGEPVLGVFSPADERHARASMLSVFPVAIGRLHVGLIEVRSHEPLTPQKQGLVEGVIKIYRNQIGLLDYSERDTLTGLLNRKTFDDQFNKCLVEDAASRARDASPLPPGLENERRSVGRLRHHWLGLIDIDHFKRVNDNHGHLIGDEVLLLTARILRDALRQADLLYRFGGEEFVVLLRTDTRERARMAFERVRSRMEAFEFPQAGRVTVSLGFTAVRAADSPNAAFERADQAVYHAKANGRNQLHCHEALIESGALRSTEKVGAIELF